jgi:hypothetical protein
MDFVVYVLAGIGLVAAILLTARYAPNAWWDDSRMWKAAIGTVVPFGYSLYLLRGRWGGGWFWCMWTVLLAIHVCAYVFLSISIHDWPTGNSFLVTIVEGTFVWGVLERISARREKREKRGRRAVS